MTQVDVAIVGGGISGLSTAFYLSQRRPHLKIALIESRSSWGGLISTAREGGFLFERGPDSLVVQKPEGIELARALGLQSELVPSTSSQEGALLWARGRLHRFPVGILMRAPIDLTRLTDSTLFSRAGRKRALEEPGIAPGDPSREESVQEFFTRRFGVEIADLLAAPLVAGVYGGNSREISMQAAFPGLCEAERKWGCVSGPAPRMRGGSSPFVSLRLGLGQLITALVGAITPSSRLVQGAVSQVSRRANGSYHLELHPGGAIRASQVVLATQAPEVARLLSRDFPALSALAQSIPYTPSLIGCFGFANDVTRRISGTGLLIPPTEHPFLLAATWVHQKFPGRCPTGQALVRCFTGAEAAGQCLEKSDDWLTGEFCEALQEVAEISEKPILARVFRWQNGLPQYTLGHRARIRQMEGLLEETRGLHCVGNYFDGVGISDAIRRAKDACEAIQRDERLLPG